MTLTTRLQQQAASQGRTQQPKTLCGRTRWQPQPELVTTVPPEPLWGLVLRDHPPSSIYLLYYFMTNLVLFRINPVPFRTYPVSRAWVWCVHRTRMHLLGLSDFLLWNNSNPHFYDIFSANIPCEYSVPISSSVCSFMRCPIWSLCGQAAGLSWQLPVPVPALLGSGSWGTEPTLPLLPLPNKPCTCTHRLSLLTSIHIHLSKLK